MDECYDQDGSTAFLYGKSGCDTISGTVWKEEQRD